MRLLLIAVLTLTACNSDPNSEEMIRYRARGHPVFICPDGTRVNQDPVTKRYSFYKPGGFFDAGAALGLIPQGVTPQEFCP